MSNSPGQRRSHRLEISRGQIVWCNRLRSAKIKGLITTRAPFLGLLINGDAVTRQVMALERTKVPSRWLQPSWPAASGRGCDHGKNRGDDGLVWGLKRVRTTRPSHGSFDSRRVFVAPGAIDLVCEITRKQRPRNGCEGNGEKVPMRRARPGVFHPRRGLSTLLFPFHPSILRIFEGDSDF